MITHGAEHIVNSTDECVSSSAFIWFTWGLRILVV